MTLDANRSAQETLPELAARSADSHKGTFGTALLMGGSRGMSGAVALAGMAALRGGAGLVRVAVPDVCLETVARFEPSYITVPLRSDRRGRISLDARSSLIKLASLATAIGCGPGLGRSLGLDALIRWLYTNLRTPMVVDADGLNALAGCYEILSNPAGPRILTPHPGEFDRLIESDRLGPEERCMKAVALAAECGVVIVLKGHHTLVTDGQRQSTNRTGNPGMATGGTGDVLTGLITALLCQELTPRDAARLGVHWHGLAGDLAADNRGQASLIASDLIPYLSTASGEIRANPSQGNA